MSTRRGSKHRSSKLTEDMVYKMRQQKLAGVPSKDIAASSGVNYKTACMAIRGANWKHVPFPKAP